MRECFSNHFPILKTQFYYIAQNVNYRVFLETTGYQFKVYVFIFDFKEQIYEDYYKMKKKEIYNK